MKKSRQDLDRKRAIRLRKIRRGRRLQALQVTQQLDNLQKEHGRLPASQVLKVGRRNRCQATVQMAIAATRPERRSPVTEIRVRPSTAFVLATTAMMLAGEG